MKYGMAELKVPAVVKPQTDMTAAIPSPTTCGELTQTVDIVLGQSQMSQMTSRPGSSLTTTGLARAQSHNRIASLLPNTVPDSSQIVNAKQADPGTSYTCT